MQSTTPHAPPRESSTRTLARALAIATPFVALAAVLGWWDGAREAALHGDAEAGRAHLAATRVRASVLRSAGLAALGGSPFVVIALFLLRWRGRVGAFALWACALQACWALPVLESDLSWRVARVRHGIEVPNLLWRAEAWRPMAAIAAGILAVAAAAHGLVRSRARARPRDAGRTGPGGRAAPVAGVGLGLAALGLALAADLRARLLHPPAVSTRKPVVFVSWDSTRADHLSCYGYERETTPNVDAFARRSVLYENAWSQHNWTRPSYASILTGEPAWGERPRRLEPSRLLLAEVLRDAGYATRALVQNPNLDFSFRMEQGFDRYLQLTTLAPPDEVADLARRSIDELAGGPFFLFVHVEQPHWPYDAGAFGGGGDPALLTAGLIERLFTDERVAAWDFDHPRAEERLALLVDLYDGDLADADRGFGAIVGHLEARGLFDETLVVFNSDHGDELLEHGGFGHAHWNVHPELTSVPLVVHYPASLGVEPARVATPAQNLDVFPTILDALGMSVPDHLHGASLLDLEADPDRAILSAYNGLVAVRTRDWSLVADHRRAEPPALYDLAADPGETAPLADPASREAFARLEGLARAWRAAYGRGEDESASAEDVSEELLERLRELGYAE